MKGDQTMEVRNPQAGRGWQNDGGIWLPPGFRQQSANVSVNLDQTIMTDTSVTVVQPPSAFVLIGQSLRTSAVRVREILWDRNPRWGRLLLAILLGILLGLLLWWLLLRQPPVAAVPVPPVPIAQPAPAQPLVINNNNNITNTISGSLAVPTATPRSSLDISPLSGNVLEGVGECPTHLAHKLVVRGTGRDGLIVHIDHDKDSDKISNLPEGTDLVRAPIGCFATANGLWVPIYQLIDGHDVIGWVEIAYLVNAH
jgi:hypothetical protein